MPAPTPFEITLASERRLAFSGKVLIPLWTLSIMSMLLNIIGYCFKLNACAHYQNCLFDDTRGKTIKQRASFGFISTIILLILWIVALFMVVFEIVRFYKKNLPASTMLRSQIILSVFAFTCLIIVLLGLFGIIQGGYKTIFDFAGTIGATAFLLGTLIYTLVIRHRRKLARRDTMNSYGMTDRDQDADMGKDRTRTSVEA